MLGSVRFARMDASRLRWGNSWQRHKDCASILPCQEREPECSTAFPGRGFRGEVLLSWPRWELILGEVRQLTFFAGAVLMGLVVEASALCVPSLCGVCQYGLAARFDGMASPDCLIPRIARFFRGILRNFGDWEEAGP